ncbi:MAG: RiPP maturation radical SAM protein 1 [bacterium]|nr:RiPP maturation radical SAM protein 1 [bacterium]
MDQFKNIKEQITSVLKGGDILFIVPPFASNNSPVMGPHILQTISHENGYGADVLYLNILFASIIGIEFAEDIGVSRLFQYWGMLTERLFARSAYGLPALGISPEFCADQARSISGEGKEHRIIDFEAKEFDLEPFWKLEETCHLFVNQAARIIASLDYKIVGCTTRMGQTNCSIALINGIKRINPEIISIVGGTNCQGEMARGIASLSDAVDYVFSGESEYTFSQFLSACSDQQLPSERIITGKPLYDLESLPLLDYKDYFTQLKAFLRDDAPKAAGVWYETSRGCWWGEKNKCTFCGQNEETLKFRQKSAGKALKELGILGERYPGVVVVMADNIMPFSYQNELLPVLAEKKEYPAIHFYYTKANLKLKELIEFKKARIEKITPGIESFSSGLLKLMNKGVTARDNLQLLKNGRAVGIDLHWFMLWGIPGDKLEDYEEILRILPLIRHFQAPNKFLCIYLERFSCYFEKPFEYEITNMRPWEVYNMIYPEWADIEKLAYYFVGEYPSEAHKHRELIEKISMEVAIWQASWKEAKLLMTPFLDRYMVLDRRGVGEDKNHVLEFPRAQEIMKYAPYRGTENQEWAVEEKIGVVVDSWYVPLVTAAPEMLQAFEENK